MSWVEKNRKINNRGGGDDYSGLENTEINPIPITMSWGFLDVHGDNQKQQASSTKNKQIVK